MRVRNELASRKFPGKILFNFAQNEVWLVVLHDDDDCNDGESMTIEMTVVEAREVAEHLTQFAKLAEARGR